MKWLMKSQPGRKVNLSIPDFPAVAVRVYLEAAGTPRVVLQFNDALLKAAQWQPGDKLLIGVDEKLDCIGLVRNDQGHAITGGMFSQPRTGKEKDSKHRPYAQWNGARFPEIVKWAIHRKGEWVPIFPESCDVHQHAWVTRGRSIEDLSRVINRPEKMDSKRRTE